MKTILLTQGKFALVDDEDYRWLSRWKWYSLRQRGNFYAIRNKGKRPNRNKLLMHREILNAQEYQGIDHKNHNGLDNRKINLRICTKNQNQHNRLPNKKSSSKHKGIYWDKSYTKKWHAQIQFNHRRIFLGRFSNEIEAAKAYDQKAKELFGEFAYTNFK